MLGREKYRMLKPDCHLIKPVHGGVSISYDEDGTVEPVSLFHALHPLRPAVGYSSTMILDLL